MKKITQKTLAHYSTLINQIESLNAEMKELKDDLVDSLKEGVKVESGPRIAKLTAVEKRSVSWKEIVIRELGKVYAGRVLAATKPFTFFKLVVK